MPEAHRPRDRAAFAYAQVTATLRKVLIYVLIGVGIGAVIHNGIPQAFVVGLLGESNPFGVVMATVPIRM